MILRPCKLVGRISTSFAQRDLLEMYRRQLKDEAAKRKLQRLAQRLRTVALELDRFVTPEK
jgi:hypothetical protein